jgi:hypothetical protein
MSFLSGYLHANNSVGSKANLHARFFPGVTGFLVHGGDVQGDNSLTCFKCLDAFNTTGLSDDEFSKYRDGVSYSITWRPVL